MQAYRLDFIDAIQLATVRYGRESIFVAGSQTLFITARTGFYAVKTRVKGVGPQ